MLFTVQNALQLCSLEMGSNSECGMAKVYWDLFSRGTSMTKKGTREWTVEEAEGSFDCNSGLSHFHGSLRSGLAPKAQWKGNKRNSLCIPPPASLCPF